MGVEDSEPVDSLVTAGKKVNNLFTALDGLINVNSDDKYRLTNELQRFQLWAVDLGLYHGGHSSLDYRFRDSPPLFKYAYKLLRDLETGLSQCVYSPSLLRRYHLLTWLIGPIVRGALGDCTVPSPNISGLESDNDDSEEEEDFSSYQKESLTEARLNNITTTVDRLYSLSFKIRNPAMRLGLSKAMKYTEVDPDTGVNLVEVYASFDQKHLAELFRCFGHQDPENLENHYLVQRLGRANTRRRQQFGYWRKRKVKYKEYSKSVEKTAANYSQTVHASHGGELSVADGPRSAPSQPSTATWLD
ncbi:hypothetical protein ACN38_g12893 [Penicillium nordicum]|uniref:Uncharacterized protein n=1 Tax=Penicillium nordicum TaxID=229535 RepID=A0A0M9W9U9_9EURO|nr:hypothetical protein ACN38_g12893 [Penicillium nordicum]